MPGPPSTGSASTAREICLCGAAVRLCGYVRVVSADLAHSHDDTGLLGSLMRTQASWATSRQNLHLCQGNHRAATPYQADTHTTKLLLADAIGARQRAHVRQSGHLCETHISILCHQYNHNSTYLKPCWSHAGSVLGCSGRQKGWNTSQHCMHAAMTPSAPLPMPPHALHTSTSSLYKHSNT